MGTRENGAALIAALMITALLATIGAAAAFAVVTEVLISANYRAAHETLYAADAGIERAMADLRIVPDWSAALSGQLSSEFDDGLDEPRRPDGTILDLARLTAAEQAETDARYGAANSNRPVWRLFGHAPVSHLLPAGEVAAAAYVVLWVADDPADGDGSPLRDSNGVALVRAIAFGVGGARQQIDATVARAPQVSSVPKPSSDGYQSVRLVAWRHSR